MAEATEAYHGHAREEAVAAYAKSWCGYKRWSNWMLRPSVQPSCCRAARNDSDAPHPLALLRARRERPRGCRAAEQRDEVAALHSITSSASESRLSEILTPSAFAVACKQLGQLTALQASLALLIFDSLVGLGQVKVPVGRLDNEPGRDRRTNRLDKV